VRQDYAVVEQLKEPYKQMVHVAMCLGLRVSEVLALKWSDFDFENPTLEVVGGVIQGRITDVKASEHVANWVFPNPNTANHYHTSPIGQDHIRDPCCWS
jgi:integrase